MKNKLLIFILMISVALCAGSPLFADVTIKAGVDVLGKSEKKTDDGTTKDNIDFSYSIGGEFNQSISPLIGLGAGAMYQFERGTGKEEDGKFNFIPIYILGMINLPAGMVSPFVAVNFGYNIFLINDEFKKAQGDKSAKGGLYWGVGGGFKLPMGLQFEVLYTVDNGKIGDAEFAYKKITASAGLNF